jgi:hypothetical protein
VYFLNLANVNLNLPIGSTQDVVVKQLAGPNTNPLVFQQTPGVFMDIASTPGPVLTIASDLSVARTINLADFVEGQPYTFELKVTNQGLDSHDSISFASGNFPFKDPVVSTSQGTCTVNPPITGLEQLGRSFNCNLGTIGPGNTVTVTARVSRLADAVAGATQVQASSPHGPRDPNHSRCNRMTHQQHLDHTGVHQPLTSRHTSGISVSSRAALLLTAYLGASSSRSIGALTNSTR